MKAKFSRIVGDGPAYPLFILFGLNAVDELDRTAFVGTTVGFFAIVNYVKLVPYAWLGQLDISNLSTALVLSPFAPVGVGLGVEVGGI